MVIRSAGSEGNDAGITTSVLMYNLCMISKDKSPQYMTSAELEEAIRRHRDFTKKLLAEARSRRANSSRSDSLQAAEVSRPIDTKK